MDDMLVFTDSWESHLSALDRVLKCLEKAGFTIKSRKCVFGKRYVKYLVHLVGCCLLAVPQDRVTAQQFDLPSTKKGLKSFLGMVGYYHWFIQEFPNTCMSAQLSPATGKDVPV